MTSYRTIRQLILVPLLVMMLLTLIVGFTAYQLTQSWESAATHSTRSLSQALTLNNIRWHLRLTQDLTRQGQEAAAQKQWEQARQLGQWAISQQTRENPVPSGLIAFLSHEDNRHHIAPILQAHFFEDNVNHAQQQLHALQGYSQSVTQLVTLSMVVLGLLLIGLTVRELSGLFQALGESRDLNISLQEEERCRIAQDLHDGIIQGLIDLQRHYTPAKVTELVEAIRRICHNLKPQILDDLGLQAALEFLADDLRQSGKTLVRVQMEESTLTQLNKAYELPLFRVVQELMNNIKRHSQATKVSLLVVYNPQESSALRIYLRDNGIGFDTKKISGGLGLRGVKERMMALKGHIKIDSILGKGTAIQLVIPQTESFIL